VVDREVGGTRKWRRSAGGFLCRHHQLTRIRDLSCGCCCVVAAWCVVLVIRVLLLLLLQSDGIVGHWSSRSVLAMKKRNGLIGGGGDTVMVNHGGGCGSGYRGERSSAVLQLPPTQVDCYDIF
jgi:hypothetical protein